MIVLVLVLFLQEKHVHDAVQDGDEHHQEDLVNMRELGDYRGGNQD